MVSYSRLDNARACLHAASMSENWWLYGQDFDFGALVGVGNDNGESCPPEKGSGVWRN